MELKGTLGFKGERGYSAYEVAVNNGFKGTEQDWLATLGTSQHASVVSTNYVTTTENETVLELPSSYMPDVSTLNIYINGLKLNSNQYTVDYSNKKITLGSPIKNSGTKVELVVFTFSSNSLPIVETIDENSTNDTTAGAKAIYDYIKEKEETQNTTNKNVQEQIKSIQDSIIFDCTVIEVEEE